MQNKHGKVRLTGTTNDEGRVLILVPSGGSYTISIESGGFKPYKNTFSVDENKMTACRIALRLNPRKMVILAELVESPITSNIGTGTATFSGSSVPPQIGSRPSVAPMHR